MKIKYLIALCVFTQTCFSHSLHADTLAFYDFETGVFSSDTETLTTASDILGTASPNSLMNGFANPSLPAGSNQGNALNFPANTETGTDSFVEFTISLGPNTQQVEFTSLSFDLFVADTLSNTTQFNYNLFSSFDNFNSSIATVVGPEISGGGPQNDNSFTSIDLTGLPASTTDVTFRIDPFFATGSASNGGGEGPGSQRLGGIDNLRLEGVATPIGVPEPSSGLVLACIGSIMLMRRRNRLSVMN